MLVLHRKKGQSLCLGDNIEISIIDLTSDGVKLAIDAPKDVKILRKELVEATKINVQSVADADKMKAFKNLLKNVDLK